jgi:SAM-dependent methyltransferase
LTTHGYQATGLDLSEDRIELARTRKQGQFVLGSLTDDFVGAHRRHFDAAMSFHAVEHMPDPVDGLRALMAVVKPGGYVLVEVPNITDEMIDQIPEYADHQWQFGHLSYFDKPRLEVMARQAGAQTFDVAGIQRYGLDHLLTWSHTHAPDLSKHAEIPTTPLFTHAEREYRRDRERRLTCDTLILTIRIDG